MAAPADDDAACAWGQPLTDVGVAATDYRRLGGAAAAAPPPPFLAAPAADDPHEDGSVLLAGVGRVPASPGVGGGAAAVPGGLLEPAFLTADERARQSRFCSYACDAAMIPVVVDLCWHRVRSRLSVTLLMMQLMCSLVLQLYLPRFNFSSVPSCVLAGFFADPPIVPGGQHATREDIDKALEVLSAGMDMYPAYLLVCLVALQEWNGAAWLLPALALAWASVGLQAAAELPACAALARLSPSQVISFADANGDVTDDDGEGTLQAYSGNPSSVIALYNLLGWAATLAVALDLTRLTVRLVGDRLALLEPAGGLWRPPLLWGSVDRADPSWRGDARDADRNACPHGGGGGSSQQPPSSFTDGLRTLYRRWLGCLPLRHVTACLVSTVGLTYTTLYFGQLLAWLGSGVATLRTEYDGYPYGDNPPPPGDNNDGDWLVYLARSSLGDAAVHPLLGSLADTAAYAPVALWAVSGALVGVMLHSLGAVNAQHAALVARYGAAADARRYGVHYRAPAAPAAADGRDPAAAARAATLRDASTPQLRLFSFTSASEYVVAHLLVHLTVGTAAGFVIVLALVAVLNIKGGAAGLVLMALAAARGWLWRSLTTTLPLVVARLVVPALRACGLDALPLLLALRSGLARVTLCFHVTDGPHVLAPRLFLNLDLVLSATLGLALGVLDGVTRLVLAAGWGVLRCVIFHEPVVPPALAALDRPFMAYGGMMRCAHAHLLHAAGSGGFGFGGTVLAPAGGGGSGSADDDDGGGLPPSKPGGGAGGGGGGYYAPAVAVA